MAQSLRAPDVTAFPDSRPPSASVLAGRGLSISARDAKRLTGHDLSAGTRSAFAYMFTVVMLCLYTGPVVLSLQLGYDPDVSYWIGRYGRAAAFIPVFFVMMHMVIMAQFGGEEKKCKKSIFVWTAILPAILLAISGGIYMSSARYWWRSLTSEECGSSFTAEKSELQFAYEEAHGMYQECRENMLAANGGVEPRWRPTLQSCTEWARLVPADEEAKAWQAYSRKIQKADQSFHSEFEYLATVEANHVCGGFCSAGPMLWNDYDVIGKQGGRCAPMVGNKFKVIRRQGEQLLVISLTGISAFFFVWQSLPREMMERYLS